METLKLAKVGTLNATNLANKQTKNNKRRENIHTMASVCEAERGCFSESVEIRWRSNIRCGMRHGSRRRAAVGSVLWNGTAAAGSPHLAGCGSSLQEKKMKTIIKKKNSWRERSLGGNVYSICYARGLILHKRASRRASKHLAKLAPIRHATLTT